MRTHVPSPKTNTKKVAIMISERARHYRFYVKPHDREAEAYIGLYLNEQSMSQEETQHAYIEVRGKVIRGVYEMPYCFITDIKHSQYKTRVTVFVQENEGDIRPYALYNRKRTPRTKQGKKVVAGIKATKARQGAKNA